MISLLVLSDLPADASDAARRRPDVELLHARTADEAVEKLGRNRRIDAVLLWAGDPERNTEAAEAILEENPASPPLFAGVPPPAPAGVRALPDRPLPELIDLVVALLERPDDERSS